MTLRRPLTYIAAAFLLSTLLTIAFIVRYDRYPSPGVMAFSGSIAGGKWALQILLGYLLLGEKRWLYIVQLATTCLIGSMILIPFAILGGGPPFFFGSLVASVLIMAIDIRMRLWQIKLPTRWYLLWLGFLALAVTLQLTVVFR
jgi:hypothetical protein